MSQRRNEGSAPSEEGGGPDFGGGEGVNRGEAWRRASGRGSGASGAHCERPAPWAA